MTSVRLQASLTILLLLSTSLGAGCADIDRQKSGAVVGAVAGGVIGNAVSEKHKKLATVVGALVGAGIGQQVGRYIDEKDKAKVMAAQQKAFDTNKPQSWKNPETGNSGRIKVIGSSQKNNENGDASPAAARSSEKQSSKTKNASQGATLEGRICKTIRQVITLKDGSTHEEDVTACKGPNGWEVV